MALVAGRGELGPGSVNLGQAIADKARATRWPTPVGADQRGSKERMVSSVSQAHAAAEVGLHVRLVVRPRRHVQTQTAVEPKRGRHVGDDQFDDSWAQLHGGDASQS